MRDGLGSTRVLSHQVDVLHEPRLLESTRYSLQMNSVLVHVFWPPSLMATIPSLVNTNSNRLLGVSEHFVQLNHFIL